MKRKEFKWLVVAGCLVIGLAVLGLWSELRPKATPLVAYLNPYDSLQEFMDGIYKADHHATPPAGYKIRAVIVPHHLAAAESIASGVRMLEGQHFSKILLLTPDHFQKCPTLLCTVNARYQTLFGEVLASPQTVTELLASPLVTESPDLFKNEHGIYAVLPFIRHYFPSVTVTPVALSEQWPWKNQREGLREVIEDRLDPDTILVLSSDFSHYLNLTQAEAMDEKTAETLFSEDLDGIASLNNSDQSDCPNGLWVLASIADRQNFYNPSVVMHTNSATLLGDPKATSTTSHFSMIWYQNDRLTPSDPAFGGDVSLARADHVPTLPKAVESWWSGDGPRVVNLEGPLAEDCGTPSANPYVFCNSEKLWNSLKSLATVWGVMNNHMLDRGPKGFEGTKKIITGAGEIALTDSGWENERLRLYAVTSLVNPVKGSEASNLSASDARVLRVLAKKTDNKLTVVLIHGGTEYSALSTEAEEKYFEHFIDAGADAVIVTHAHVPRDVQIYRNRPIFRGLGNYLFDQRDSHLTATGELVRLKKTGEHVSFETLITRMDNP